MNYLSFGDPPSGVYLSQVTNVCSFLTGRFETKVRLIAFISLRGYWGNRRRIKAAYRRSWVIPSFPKLRFWRVNAFLLCILCLFLRDKSVLARGVLATQLALRARKWGLLKRVMYDGRGAWQAELKEFEVSTEPRLVRQAFNLEKQAVLKADYRLAVSSKMIAYWREQFKYQGQDHVVIPCTLHTDFPPLPSAESLHTLRQEQGYTPEDIVLVYSGSAAGWQALKGLDAFLLELMAVNKRVKVRFLAPIELKELDIHSRFPDRVSKDWIAPAEVPAQLALCDYGLLIRDSNTTNQVASPTKFAEYLACGLQVLISEGIGDYSERVEEMNWGKIVLVQEGQALPLSDLHPQRYEDKKTLSETAIREFGKENYAEQYRQLQ